MDIGWCASPEPELHVAQTFATWCTTIITQAERDCPPQPNAHIIFDADFIDPLETQIRKEYVQAQIDSCSQFRVKLALESATSAKLVKLETGYTQPKFFKIFPQWDQPQLIPFRLYDKAGIKFAEARIDGQWRRIAALLSSLAGESAVDYDSMTAYWKHIQTTRQSKASFLLALPFELRLQIYKYLLFEHLEAGDLAKSPQYPIHAYARQGPPVLFADKWPRDFLSMLRVSPQIFNEVVTEYYRLRAHAFICLTQAEQFLCGMPATHYKLLRRLELVLCTRAHLKLLNSKVVKTKRPRKTTQKMDKELVGCGSIDTSVLASLTGLRHLKIGLMSDPMKITFRNPWEAAPYVPTWEDIVTGYVELAKTLVNCVVEYDSEERKFLSEAQRRGMTVWHEDFFLD